LNEVAEEQDEAVRHQDFVRAQILLEKMKELQEELQTLNAEPVVVHEQVKTLFLLYSITSFSLVSLQKAENSEHPPWFIAVSHHLYCYFIT
jgi:hypothetical protein